MKDIRFNKKIVLDFVKRFHLVIFVVIIVLLLSVAILLLSGIVNKASGENATPQNGISTNFDEDTIERINQLKTSAEPSQPLDLSQGRISPFSE